MLGTAILNIAGMDNGGRSNLDFLKKSMRGFGATKTGYVLAQTAESPGSIFNLCVGSDITAKDVEVSVALKSSRSGP